MPLRLSTGLRNKLLGQKTNLLSNGSFDSATTGWTGSGATLSSASGGQSGNCLTITNSGAAKGAAYADITTRVGRVYLLTYYFDLGTGAAGGSIKIGTTADDDAIFTSPAAHTDTDWTQKMVAFVATETTTRITLVNESTTSGETAKFDTLVCEELVEGLKNIMHGAKINIYSGSQPADADTAASGTLLVTISLSGGATGFSWDEPSAGAISKPSGDTWQGTAVATGTAGWFRLYEDGDTPASSSTAFARIDGSVATSGGQLNMSSTAITSGAVQTISAATFTQPAS